LSIFVPFGMTLPEWQPALPVQPEWWDLPNLATAPVESQTRPPQKPPARRAAPPPSGQPQLFETPPLPTPAAPAAPLEDWIDTLLRSTVYASQRALAARVAPPDDQMRKLLAALEERGGKLSRAALAQRLSVPEVRLSGMLSAVRRILNVDQATVLWVDESASTVELNRSLLMQQFRITVVGVGR
jgi:hypothetical protein